MKLALVIDTNIIYAYKNDKCLEFQVCKDFSQLIELKKTKEISFLKIFVSQITVEEIISQKNKVHADMIKKLYDYKKYFSSDFNLNGDKIEPNIRESVESYFKCNSINIINYKNIELSKIIERSLENKSPFSENSDKGFKDTIIWESILSNNEISICDQIYLFTKDNDFNPMKLESENKKIKIIRSLEDVEKK